MSGPLQALVDRYDRLAAKGEVAAFGLSWERISYALAIDRDGAVIDVQPLLDTPGKKPQPQALLVPQSFKRPGITPRSFFLWDKTSFVFGLSADKSKQQIHVQTLGQHAAFRKHHGQLLVGADDEGLRALLAFLERWKPERFAARPFKPEMLDANFVFELDGDDRYLHERPAAKEIWLAHLASGDAVEGMCLITGRTGPIARLHPSIKGVLGAQSSGASLVSFNEKAYESHGKEQGLNAPVSEAAAFGYGTALNALLARESRNIVRIGDATVVFWAEAPEAEAIGRGLFGRLGPDTKGGEQRLRAILEQMAKGQGLKDIDPELDEGTRFYILGLSPNDARLSVRLWLQTEIGTIALNFIQHWRDLALENDELPRSPSIPRLVYELSSTSQRRGKTFGKIIADKRLAKIGGDIARSVITGTAYPAVLLTECLIRLRANTDVRDERTKRVHRAMSRLRVCMIKAYLLRINRIRSKSRGTDMNSLVGDDRIPLRLGKLFALFERAQLAALGNVNSTIRDRYYASASTIPQRIFPMLFNNYRNHSATLRKGRGAEWVKNPKQLGVWLEQQIGTTVASFEHGYPRNLTSEDQGWFAIGYYKERFQRKDKPADLKAVDDAEAADADDATDTPAQEG